MPVVFDDVGIVDVTSSNQPEEFRVNETVPADGKRERNRPCAPGRGLGFALLLFARVPPVDDPLDQIVFVNKRFRDTASAH